MPLAIVFIKVALIGVISWNWTPLLIILSDCKIDKKKIVPFSVLSLEEPVDKKGTLFHLLQTNVIDLGIFIYRKAFINQFSIYILNRLDIDKKRSQNQNITVWWRTLKKGTLFSEKRKGFFKFSKNYV